MGSYNILFEDGKAVTTTRIRDEINIFGESYNETIKNTISDSIILNADIFMKCVARLLSNFKMTRNGPFRGVGIKVDGSVEGKDILLKCWDRIGNDLIDVKGAVLRSEYSRGRYLIELADNERIKLTGRIWDITKKLLPITMGEYSYGLVGASKILFSVLPEIVLPVDNSQWLRLFQTVDLGDIINYMVLEIRAWEQETHEKINEIDLKRGLTTPSSIYNVMAMKARPKKQ